MSEGPAFLYCVMSFAPIVPPAIPCRRHNENKPRTVRFRAVGRSFPVGEERGRQSVFWVARCLPAGSEKLCGLLSGGAKKQADGQPTPFFESYIIYKRMAQDGGKCKAREKERLFRRGVTGQ